MLDFSPRKMIVVGVLMMTVGGVIVPLLMVIHILESTFILIFASYGMSVAGLYLGIIGVARFMPTHKKDR